MSRGLGDVYKRQNLHTQHCDALIMAAAVADYSVKDPAKLKIKKDGAQLVLELERTTDILATVSGSFLKIGFAAESHDLLKNAREKLLRKQLDLIVANDITSPTAVLMLTLMKLLCSIRTETAKAAPDDKREISAYNT